MERMTLELLERNKPTLAADDDVAIWQVVSRNPLLRNKPEPQAAGRMQPRPGLRDPLIWAFMLAYAWGALPIALVIYGAAIFLHKSMGASQLTIGEVLWIPPLGWEIGYFLWGWLADRQVAAGRQPRSA